MRSLRTTPRTHRFEWCHCESASGPSRRSRARAGVSCGTYPQPARSPAFPFSRAKKSCSAKIGTTHLIGNATHDRQPAVGWPTMRLASVARKETEWRLRFTPPPSIAQAQVATEPARTTITRSAPRGGISTERRLVNELHCSDMRFRWWATWLEVKPEANRMLCIRSGKEPAERSKVPIRVPAECHRRRGVRQRPGSVRCAAHVAGSPGRRVRCNDERPWHAARLVVDDRRLGPESSGDRTKAVR